jgi:hypothetical protein
VGVAKAVPASLGGSSPGSAAAIPATFDSGPAIVQATVPWSAAYACDAAMTPLAMAGTSTITVFPSGRIVRSDQMVQGTTAGAATTANCGCDANNFVGSLQLSTFWGFGSGGSDVNADDSLASNGQARGCTLYSNETLAVAFSDTATHHGTGDVSSYLHDFQAGGGTLDSTVYAYTSAMQIAGPGKCSATVGLLDDVSLMFEGSAAQTDNNGIYQIGARVDHELDFTTSGGATVPPGFAMALDFVPDHVSIAIDNTPATFATQASGSNGRTLLYIAESLGSTSTLVIKPE